jgi:hypothetical protein
VDGNSRSIRSVILDEVSEQTPDTGPGVPSRGAVGGVSNTLKASVITCSYSPKQFMEVGF